MLDAEGKAADLFTASARDRTIVVTRTLTILVSIFKADDLVINTHIYNIFMWMSCELFPAGWQLAVVQNIKHFVDALAGQC